MTFYSEALRRAAGGLVLLMAGAIGAQAEAVISSKGEERLAAFITGYTFWDNTPPGSAAIARPVVHDEAGGTGTFDDPITVAVGRSGSGWRFAPGTRLYIEGLRKYAVVEDLCGSCGKGHGGNPWLDLYVGGSDTGSRMATQCAMKITGVQDIVLHPTPGYPVAPGELAESCRVF